MENKINIAKILEDCPSGMELDCSMWNNVVFDHIDTTSNYPIYIKKMGGELEYLTEDGHFNLDCDAKCVIFPKGKTTWEGFHRPFVEGDIVTWQDRGSLVACIYKERKNTASFYHHIALYIGGIGIILNNEIALTDDELCFATEEEKEKLFQAIKDNGYKWNEETKTLEKLIEPNFKVGDIIQDNGYEVEIIEVNVENKYYEYKSISTKGIGRIAFSKQDYWELVPNKFDINTLVPFESRVLVRDNIDEVWLPCFFGGICNNNNYPYRIVGGERWKCCIPYEGNEHLLNKKENCDEYFKNW